MSTEVSPPPIQVSKPAQGSKKREATTPDLRWVKPPRMLQMLAKATVPNGSFMAIEGTGYSDDIPEAVSILRSYTPFISAIRKLGRLPKYADLNDTIPVRKLIRKNGCIRSKTFPLTTSGFLHTQRWVCRDPDETYSPLLRTSRFVDVSIEDSAQVRGSKLLRIRARVAAPKDPIIDLSIVTPDQTHDRCSFFDVLESHANEALIDSHRARGRSATATRDFIRIQTEDYLQEPAHWQAWVSPSRLVLNAGGEADILINVLPGAPGKLPLAVVAAESSTNDFSISNIVVLDQGNDGSIKMLYGENRNPSQSEDDPMLSPYYDLVMEAMDSDIVGDMQIGSERSKRQQEDGSE